MKLSNLVYLAVGYTLGARAGRERYEDIVRIARRVAGSQTVQSTAGVVEGHVERLTAQVREAISSRVLGHPSTDGANANGHRP